jgi:hypothetical protein
MFEIGAFSTFHSFENEFLALLTTTASSPFALGKAAASLLRGFTYFDVFTSAFLLGLELLLAPSGSTFGLLPFCSCKAC